MSFDSDSLVRRSNKASVSWECWQKQCRKPDWLSSIQEQLHSYRCLIRCEIWLGYNSWKASDYTRLFLLRTLTMQRDARRSDPGGAIIVQEGKCICKRRCNDVTRRHQKQHMVLFSMEHWWNSENTAGKKFVHFNHWYCYLSLIVQRCQWILSLNLL